MDRSVLVGKPTLPPAHPRSSCTLAASLSRCAPSGCRRGGGAVRQAKASRPTRAGAQSEAPPGSEEPPRCWWCSAGGGGGDTDDGSGLSKRLRCPPPPPPPPPRFHARSGARFGKCFSSGIRRGCGQASASPSSRDPKKHWAPAIVVRGRGGSGRRWWQLEPRHAPLANLVAVAVRLLDDVTPEPPKLAAAVALKSASVSSSSSSSSSSLAVLSSLLSSSPLSEAMPTTASLMHCTTLQLADALSGSGSGSGGGKSDLFPSLLLSALSRCSPQPPPVLAAPMAFHRRLATLRRRCAGDSDATRSSNSATLASSSSSSSSSSRISSIPPDVSAEVHVDDRGSHSEVHQARLHHANRERQWW